MHVIPPEIREVLSSYSFIKNYMDGKISKEDFHGIECHACPGAGSCGGMYTANTMACITEVLGMSLTKCATTLALSPEKKKQAYETGKRIVELVKKNITPSTIGETPHFTMFRAELYFS